MSGRKKKTTRKWTFQEEAKLIELYRRRPQLWNPSTRGYKQKHIRSQLMNDISTELGITLPAVQDKLRKLRIYFFQLLKKESYNSNANHAGSETSSSIVWPFYDSLMFLQEIRDKQSQKNNSGEVSELRGNITAPPVVSLQDESNEQICRKACDDEEDLFGRIVARHLKNIANEQQRDALKTEIMRLLYMPLT